MPLRAIAVGRVVEAVGAPDVGRLIFEAGRSEGNRAAREKRHTTLYRWHQAALVALLAPVLKRLDADALSASLVTTAAAAGRDVRGRLAAVSAVAEHAIRQSVRADDRQALVQANALGYAHATAEGTGQARATPAVGGPPNPSKTAEHVAALLAVPALTAATTDRAAIWVDTEIHGVAMGAAIAAGNGADAAAASRRVAQALVDTGRATAEYANGLHRTVMTSYLQRITTLYPGRLVDFITAGGNVCPICLEIEGENPWDPDSVTVPPVHFNCQCHLELASMAALAA